jgi:hypothetical protein
MFFLHNYCYHVTENELKIMIIVVEDYGISNTLRACSFTTHVVGWDEFHSSKWENFSNLFDSHFWITWVGSLFPSIYSILHFFMEKNKLDRINFFFQRRERVGWEPSKSQWWNPSPIILNPIKWGASEWGLIFYITQRSQCTLLYIVCTL